MGIKVQQLSEPTGFDEGVAHVLVLVDATPTDALFDETPPDGTIVLEDNENGTGDLYVRVNGGTWLKVTNATA